MPEERQRFATSIGASALLHLLVLAAIFLWITGSPKRPVSIPSVEVDLSSLSLPKRAAAPAASAPRQESKPPPAVLPKRQIVEPSDAGEEREPQNANLLSDRNNTVPDEAVHHGDQGTDADAAESHLTHPSAGVQEKQPPQKAPAPAPPAPRPKEAPRAIAPPVPKERPKPAPARPEPGEDAERLASIPRLDQLLPSAIDQARQEPLPEATPRPERGGRDLLNSGGEVFGGRPGTRDYLPRVREGNVTMLNTKADLFAPFVRRVAGRVFENLDLAFSNMRYRHGLGSGRAQATVEAIMDRSGHFVTATLMEHSGVNAVGVDRLLLGAATPDTFFDANPPPGAEANDGKIHFVLLVDLMVETVPNPRSGRESVSYYGIAGVGLK